LENGDLELGFDLPRGAYATALLRELAVLEETR
jgi:tRNA(Glu) U13 pseudouridine synthase TruD